ncbi:MAG: type IV pilus assembly protein PilQ [Lysobacterales bacterium]
MEIRGKICKSANYCVLRIIRGIYTLTPTEKYTRIWHIINLEMKTMYKNITISITLLLSLLSLSPQISYAQEVVTEVTVASTVNQVATEAMDLVEYPETIVIKQFTSSIDELDVKNMNIQDVLQIISLKTGLAINVDDNLEAQVSITFKEIDVFDGLRIILDTHDLAYIQLKQSSNDEPTVQVMTSERFESLYGYAFSSQTETKTVPLLYGDANAILLELQQLKTTNGKIIFDKNTQSFILMDNVSHIEDMIALIEAKDVVASKILGEEEHSSFEDEIEDIVVQEIESIVDANEDTIADQQSIDQAMLDDKSKKDKFRLFRRNRDTIEKFQASINVLEITLNDEYQDGVDWAAIVSNYQGLPFLGFRSTAKNDPDGELRLGSISDEDYVVLLEALDTVGIVETLFEDKTKEYLETEFLIDVKPSDRLHVTDIREYKEMFKRNEMVRFKVLTTKDAEGLFKIGVSPEIKPNYYTQGLGQVVVDLADKHMVVIGGIFKDIKIEGTRKIPILGDLPFLGFAFRDQKERIRKAEYIVFITFETIE